VNCQTGIVVYVSDSITPVLNQPQVNNIIIHIYADTISGLSSLFFRVWKGILGIWALTKIWCGILENEKYLDGIWDLTTIREAGFAKIWAWDAGFFACLSGIREIVTTQINVMAAKANQPGERKISIERASLHLKFISFCRN